jgi:hypothetical protein
MEIYNLMPHACDVFHEDGEKTVLESKGELRLKSSHQKTLPSIAGMPIVEPQSFVGLDETSKGYKLFMEKRALGPRVAFVVSVVTAQWLAAHDTSGCRLLAPATGPQHAVRDASGRIMGCKALELYR